PICFVGLFAWFLMEGVPGPVWGITIFFALIMALFAADVWCDRYELRIEQTEVVVTKPRPWGTKVVRVPRTEVAAVRPEKAMSSGESQDRKSTRLNSSHVKISYAVF